MSKSPTIDIGKYDDGHHVKMDVARLVVSRLLITASSGGGKSYFLRRLLEQLTKTTQNIVIDTEGEFATLREKRDMVLAGPAGETPADPRSASLLCRRLMELNVSAVIDISELARSAKREFVANFVNTLVDLPRNLWRPCIVTVDEIHEFAPEGEKSESGAALASLASKGRKRGYALLGATQRLQKLDTDIRAELKNVCIGQMVLDVDLKRAADLLGFSKDRWSDIRDLSPPGQEGEFFGFGPAFHHRGVMKFRGGQVETTHPKAGQGRLAAPPQPSGKILGVLDELKDLPQQAEAEIKDLSAAKKKIAELEKDLKAKERELKVSPEARAVAKKGDAATAQELRAAQGTIRVLRQGLEQAMKLMEQAKNLEIGATGIDPEVVKRAVETATTQIVKAAQAANTQQQASVDRLKRDLGKAVANMQQLLEKAGTAAGAPATPTAPAIAAQASRGKDAAPALSPESRPPQDAAGRDGLPGPEKKILDALAWFESIGVAEPEQSAVAFKAGYTYGAGGFNNPRGSLRGKGLIEYLSGDKMKLTEAGRALAQFPAEQPTSLKELHDSVLKVLPGPETKILAPLLAAYPNAMTNEALAEASGYTHGAGGYNNPRGRLRSLGLIEYVNGEVKARSILFPEGLS